ncbi:MAG TPA: polyprenyl synthetase family protein [Spirochaetia bacterium]|nr:polyprenyl synthetase family protein [Spirochaetia bacterium]
MLAVKEKADLASFLATSRQEISAILRNFVSRKKQELALTNELSASAMDRLLEFALAGKMIRGSLVALGASAFEEALSQHTRRSAWLAGAAIELFHAGLLVHDDIMDRDDTRRGHSTISHQYAADTRWLGARDWRHAGEALGICVGDVAFFLGCELIAGLPADPSVTAEILELFSRELSAVGIAQMQDVLWGALAGARPLEDEIIRMYRFKTGRYTFSLPLRAGAMLAGASREVLDSLDALGECMGILFQVRDDELGLFGTEETTGKPVGSDVKEGKKTLLHARLFACAGAQEKKRLSRIFGNPKITQQDLAFVTDLAESRGVRDSIRATVESLFEKARSIIRSLPDGSPDSARVLLELLDFTMRRQA